MSFQDTAMVALIAALVLLALIFLIWLADWVIEELCPDEKAREERAKRDVEELLKQSRETKWGEI